jgi:hypothetical protein
MPDYKPIDKYPESEIPYSRQPKEKLLKKFTDKKMPVSQKKLIRNELSKRLDRGQV